jgi:hypothetical protein
MIIQNQSDRSTSLGTRSSCLRTAGISCLVVFIAGLVLMWLGVRWLLNSPMGSQAKMSVDCRANLLAIGGGLERYLQRNGKYPDKLADLYPNFLEDKDVLHCPADAAPAGKVSYDYVPPARNARPDTIVIICRRHILVKGQPPWIITLQKDGKVNQYTPEIREPSSGAPPTSKGGKAMP